MINPKEPDYSLTPAHPSQEQAFYAPSDLLAPPVVSIITPFYNTGEIFHETALSVLRQSLQQWEWIIINDGSDQPEAQQILEPYRTSDPRIRVIDHPQNLGLPAARNTGFQHAQTPYGLLLDSDDLLEPTAAEKWFWFLESHPEYAFVGSYSVGFGAHQYLWTYGFHNGEVNLERNRIDHTSLVRKCAHQAVGGFDETLRGGLEDWDFWIRCANAGFWGATLPEFLHWYRTRATHTDVWENLQEKKLAEFRNRFHEKYPSLWKGGFPNICTVVSTDYVSIRKDLPAQNQLLKKKPRLLLIVPWLVVGGTEKFNLEMIHQLSMKGWEITVAVTSSANHEWLYEYARLTPDIFLLNQTIQWADYPVFFRYLILSRQIDAVLLSGSTFGYRLLPYLRTTFPDLPLLDFVHSVIPFWMEGGFARLSAAYSAYLNLTITASQQVKDWLIAQGVNPNQAEVCTININTQLWHPNEKRRSEIREKWQISDDAVLIFYVSRLEKEKQPAVFIKTLHQLIQQGLPVFAWVVGDGSEFHWLKKYIRAHHLERQIHLFGALPSDQVRNILVAGDIIFLPSKAEGIAQTFYEGMACGLVPVGSDVGGQRELVTPECGILLPRGSEDEETDRYTQVLRELIQNPQKRIQMAKAGRERICTHFSIELVGERMISLLTQAKERASEQPNQTTLNMLSSVTAQHAVEYAQVKQEYDRLYFSNATLNDNAPPSVYLYYAIRAVLLPVYKKLLGLSNPKLVHLKNWLKTQWVK